MRLDLRAKFALASKIEEVAEEVNGRLTYSHGWGDARLAREFNVSPDVVRNVRKTVLPEMQVVPGGGPGRPGRSTAFRREIDDLRLENAEIKERLSALEGFLYKTNQAA